MFPCPWRLLQNVTMDTGFLCDKEAGLRETTKEALCLIVDRRMQDDILVVSGEVVLELCHIRTTRIDAKKRRDLARGISTPAPLHHMSLSPGPHPRARPTLLTIRHRPDSCSLPDHFVQLQCYMLTLRRLMSYIYGAPILDVSRSHTTTQHSR